MVFGIRITSCGRLSSYVVGVPSWSDAVVVSAVVVEVDADLGDLRSLLPVLLTVSDVRGVASPTSLAATLTVSAVCCASIEGVIPALVVVVFPVTLPAFAVLLSSEGKVGVTI